MEMDEVDSGVEEVSVPQSREGSPAMKNDQVAVKESEIIAEDDDDLDETLTERLWGLTEMFPQIVRKGTWTITTNTLATIKEIYGLSRSVLWIFFSSSAILFAPIIFEMERMQLQDDQRQQQRQILLGPSAAVAGGSPHGMGMPMPVPQSPTMIGGPPLQR